MIESASGLVIRYSYLWAREHFRGEETGRKDRPVCVQVVTAGPDNRVRSLLFAITSQPPRSGTACVEIPPLEARRTGIRAPAWVVVDEWNEDDLTTSPYLADVEPLGSFSRAFAALIARAAVVAIKSGGYRRVAR